MRALAGDLGIDLPTDPDFVEVGVAAAVVALALLLAAAAGRWGGPPLAKFWERRAGSRGEEIAPRISAIVRYFALWLVPALALGIRAWPPLAALLLGVIAAAAAALLARQIARGLHLPRWAAWAFAAFLFVAILADAVGGLAPLSAALDGLAFTVGSRRLSLLMLVQAVVALFALYMVVRLANRLVGHSIKHAGGLDPAQRLLAQKLAAIAIFVLAFLIAIDLTGIDLTALAVFSGALGLAVGFGLQKTVGNLFAGIILLMDRSIKPGDIIVVGDTFGQVTKIGVRAVSVITRDGKEHLIPNEDLMTREVENWSYSSRNVRLHISVGVSYACDLPLAQKLMIQAAEESPRVMKSPRPNVWLREFGESSVDHDIMVWIPDPESGVGNVQSEILNRLWHLFKENGIEIPFPQRDVHVKDWPAAPAAKQSPSSDDG